MNKKMIEKYIRNVCEVEISGKGITDNTARLVFLATKYPELAADTILRREMIGKLESTLNFALNELSRAMDNNELNYEESENVYRTFIEVILNLIGLESEMVGFTKEERERALRKIVVILKKWTPELAIRKTLQNMKQVMKGNSLAAKMAENIERELDEANLVESFVGAAKKGVQNNVYYRMASQGMGKFGNDSATGLRVVRHFNFVQVSSNPVIAARAYEEFPHLWDNFKEIIKVNLRWWKNPEKYSDEIALHGTLTSLLPNLIAFRPIALLSNFCDGLVSYQLNPVKSTDSKASLKDAKKICSILKEILYRYDAWLGWNPDEYQGRPNIVFKVAACHPAAIRTTVGLNREGIGTNNTVTFSVSQELRLLIAEAEGMALALKKGVFPTQVYQTNMIGRTEDHLKAIVDEEMKPFTEYSGIYVTRKVYKLFFAPENRVKWRNYLERKFDLSQSQAELILDRIDMLPASKRRARDTYWVLGTPNVTNTEFPNQQLKVYEASLEEGFDLESFRDSIKKEPDPAILEKLLEIKDFVKIYELTPWLAKKLKEVGIEVEGNGRRGMKSQEWSNYGAVQKTMAEFKNAYLNFKQKAIEFVKQSAAT